MSNWMWGWLGYSLMAIAIAGLFGHIEQMCAGFFCAGLWFGIGIGLGKRSVLAESEEKR